MTITESQLAGAERAVFRAYDRQQDIEARAAEEAGEAYAEFRDSLRDALLNAPQTLIDTPAWYSAHPSAIGRKQAKASDIAYEWINDEKGWQSMLAVVIGAAKAGDPAAVAWLDRVCCEFAQQQVEG